jgi:hypothetical protein
MRHSVIIVHALGSRADYFQVAYDSLLDQYLSKEFLSTAMSESLDSLDAFEDVCQLDAGIFRHSGLASLRMRRRSNQ